MDWLIKLPVVGPLVERLMRTHAWRSYETLERAHWTRLAAAITFLSFLALFPLITFAAAIIAAALDQSAVDELNDKIAEQIPGISDQLDINALVANAGTVGLVSGVLLLLTGASWVGAMRDCLRAVWGTDDEDEGNPVLRKAKDVGVLVGLGCTGLLTFAVSALGSSAIGWTMERLGLEEGGVGGVLLRIGAVALAVLANFLILLYLLTLLPGAHPPRRRLMVAALIGAVGFELLKLLLSGYLSGVASRSMYGAFGVPIALLLWINFTAKLLLYCAAWTATPSGDDEPAAEEATEGPGGSDARDGSVTDGGSGASGRAAASGA
ncbi:YihY/virulence factor BrkB family protein [Streptomyces genisteinicus]|uniref:YihY/virulence factor BrkB family protein n=1 Tax=Streptomyces genisteinicus TaxID=2768068 RepID=A0A7H0HWF5_9ACTN|nr:YihY/virulence factor BrkB family protein [Streptomyces genisteinicus]QNP64871.1 YihY/virulence factor BrkB family protein [Streptomyces genisteinicus]